jgi:small neutral amino acid transporter SnatA (MarC family)
MDPSVVSAVVLRRIVPDPVGNIPVLVAAVKDVRQQRQRATILRERLFAIAVLLPLVFVGGLSLRGSKTFIAGL